MPKAKKKRTRIKIEGQSNSRIYSLSSSISFAWVSSPANGRKQLNSFHTCRDHINDDMRSFYHQDNSRISSGATGIDTKRLRLLIAAGLTKEMYEDWKQALYNAKNIINIYETLAGFDQTSVLTRVDYFSEGVKSDKVEYCWLLTGPGEWVRYSQLMSMLTLILRAVTRYRHADGLETIEQVEDYWQRLIKESRSQDSGLRHSDATDYLPNCWRKFHMIMKWHDRIFKLSGEEAHTPGESWHSCGGINSLCNFLTRMETIDKPMREAWKEWQEKHPVKG